MYVRHILLGAGPEKIVDRLEGQNYSVQLFEMRLCLIKIAFQNTSFPNMSLAKTSEKS